MFEADLNPFGGVALAQAAPRPGLQAAAFVAVFGVIGGRLVWDGIGEMRS